MSEWKCNTDKIIGFTWVLPDSSIDDLTDVFQSLSVVLQTVVAQGDVVGQS